MPAYFIMNTLLRYLFTLLGALLVMGPVAGTAQIKAQFSNSQKFRTFLSKDWKVVFEDPCTGDWKQKWTLDGETATVANTKSGMEFKAGPEARNDAHHAVLWTK